MVKRSDLLLSPSVTAARRLLESLDIRQPGEIDVELIAAHCGAHVVFRDLENEEGRLLRTGKVGLIVVSRLARSTEKWRFVVAHELGHFLRHAALDQFRLCTEADLNQWYLTSGHEVEANYFAAELLLPEPLFAPRCDRNRPSLKDVRELAAEFSTSLTATAIRFVACAPEPCAIVHSSNGTIDWTWRNHDFRIFLPARGHRLTRDTYAGDLSGGVAVDDRPQLVDGSAWSANSTSSPDVLEHSIRLGRYGSVLTFLWHAA